MLVAFSSRSSGNIDPSPESLIACLTDQASTSSPEGLPFFTLYTWAQGLRYSVPDATYFLECAYKSSAGFQMINLGSKSKSKFQGSIGSILGARWLKRSYGKLDPTWTSIHCSTHADVVKLPGTVGSLCPVQHALMWCCGPGYSDSAQTQQSSLRLALLERNFRSL